MFKILDGKTSFHQWDINQKLIVFNPEVKEVHFTNATLGKALVVEVYTEGEQRLAEVPNIILQDAFDIKVYGFCGECVRDKKTFNVIARAKPEDYIYTEVELKNFESLEETVFNAIGEQNAQLKEYVDTVKDNEKRIEVIEKELETPTFKRVFKDNTWEQIAIAAKMGVAQNYWNVGDYKDISIDTYELECLSSYGIDILINPKLFSVWGLDKRISIKCWWKSSSNPDGWYIIIKNLDSSVVGGGVSYTDIETVRKLGVYPQTEGDGEVVVKNKQVVKNYPVQIIGFNHDKVANKRVYGRDRAGITLQIGVSRNFYGDNKPSLLDMNIGGIMINETYYKSPNSVLTDYTEGATNWTDGGYRLALQTLLDKTELAPYLVEVQKYTSQYFDSTNKWYAPMLSSDKVFLLSEYEVFGEVFRAPAKEGEQYELYQDGYSKFMWSKELLNGQINGARLWLRSANGGGVSPSTKNTPYTISVYEHVSSRNPLKVNYMPSQASNGKDGVPAYIAPCFCI